MARRRSKNSSTIALDANKMSQEIRAIILQEGMAIIGDLAEMVAQEANANAPELQDEIQPASESFPHPRGPNKRNGDHRSGPIKGNIFARPSKTIPTSWLVVSPSWYSHFMEYGTEPHGFGPRNKKNMKFPGTNEWAGTAVYASHVDHPGIRPKPYLRPAADKAENFLIEILKKRYGV